MSTFLLFVTSLFSNFWIWRIFSSNVWIAVILIIVTTTFFLYVSVLRKKLLLFGLLLFLILLAFQYKSADSYDLTYLDNDEQRVQQQRIREYPLVYIPIGGKAIWLPVSKWFEESKFSVGLSRVEKNLFEILDPNLYFFAGSPRPRVGISEYEKFPYILLPFFIWGLFNIRKNKYLFAMLFFLPVILLSVTGNKDPLGPYSLFPFISLSISLGLISFYSKLKKHRLSWLIYIFMAILIIVSLQLYGYENY